MWKCAAQELLERSLTAELEVPKKSNRQGRQLENNKL